jgi:ABC-type transporter Mla subunit MlaD
MLHRPLLGRNFFRDIPSPLASPALSRSSSEASQQGASKCEKSWRDGMMITLELGSTGAGLYSLFYSPPLAISMFAFSILTCIAHGCWRRDARIADMNRLVANIAQDNEELNKTTKKTEVLIDRILVEGQHLQEEKKTFIAVEQELEKETQDLALQNKNLREAHEGLSKTNEKLQAQNEKLQMQISQFQEFLKSLNAHFINFCSENEKLKLNVSLFSQQVSHMSESRETFKKIMGSIDVELTKDFRELSTNVIAMQDSCQEIFRLLDEKNRMLSQEIESAKLIVDAFEKTDRDLRKKTEKLEELEKQIEGAKSQIERLQKELMDIASTLEMNRKKLSEETLQLADVHHSLQNDQRELGIVKIDLNQVATRLEQDEVRMQGLVNSLNQFKVSLKQEIEELEKV